MTTQVLREMTEQERQGVIEKAARAYMNRWEPNASYDTLPPDVQEDVKIDALSVLKAVGFFELREAAERIRYADPRSENYQIAWIALNDALYGNKRDDRG